MKTLYFQCNMGAAGDMLTAALLELFDDRDAVLQQLNELGIPGVTYTAQDSIKCGIHGTHVTVVINGTSEEEQMHDHDHDHGEHHHHHHTHMHDIEEIVANLHTTAAVKENVLGVYKHIAEAESHAHHMPVEEIHFHEVGSMDAVADITAVCWLLDQLKADQIICSPIATGYGQVQCAHGILPVPAPATAYILQGVPCYSGNVEGELCTPTGAALLKQFVNSFGQMPVMNVQKIGYGMGGKDFPAANCVRVFLGTLEEERQTVSELYCTVDDMTGEEIGFASEKLMAEGALDVYTVAIGMKKSRPGVLLNVTCLQKDQDRMASLIFKHTTTLGIKITTPKRYRMKRTIETETTDLGEIRIKKARFNGLEKTKYEYEDLARIAREKNLSLAEVKDLLSNEN